MARIKKRPITPQDMLRLILVSDPQVSPDGTRVLFTRKHVGDKNQYVSNLWLVPAGGGEPRPLSSGGKDGRGRWSPDGSAIAFVSGRDRPRQQLYLLRADGGEATALTRFPEGSIGDFHWSPDGGSIAVAFRETDPAWTEEAGKKREETGASRPPRVIDKVWYRLDGDGYFNHQRHQLYLVELPGGQTRKVFDGNHGGPPAFAWSPDSRELALVASRDERSFLEPWRDRIHRLDLATGKLELLPRQKDGVKTAIDWSPDGSRISWVGRDDRTGLWLETNYHLFVADADTGVTEKVTSDEDYCLLAEATGDTREIEFRAHVRWHPDGKRLLSTLAWQGATQVAVLPARRGRLRFLTRGARDLSLGNLSRDGSVLALTAGSVLAPGEVQIGRLAGDRLELRPLTAFNRPLLEELELSEPEEHWVPSTGKTRVHTWVMRPPGLKPGRKVPAVLEVHGGPHVLYGWSFFHEMQVLAAAGYAVFFSNPRGSKGYGESHAAAIRGHWGGVDWEDIQAVTRFMQDQRWVDGKRLGIMGGSYGGYMTNWAIGHSHAYRAAVTDRCVSNLVSMAGTSDFPVVATQYWEGTAWDRPEALWDQSPIAHFKDVRTPTLVIHSEGDLRCNIEQGEQVFSALQLLGVETRFVRYPAEASHGMSRSGPPDLRLHRLGQILDWWKRHLG